MVAPEYRCLADCRILYSIDDKTLLIEAFQGFLLLVLVIFVVAFLVSVISSHVSNMFDR